MRTIRALIASLLGFGFLEALIFHSGLYTSIVKPDSSTGVVEEILRDLTDVFSDTRMLAGRLGLHDLFEYPASFRTLGNKWDAFRSILLKGFAFSVDFQDFMKDPAGRLRTAALLRREWHVWLYDYIAPSTTMEGITVDWMAQTITFPPVSATNEAEVRAVLLNSLPPYTGRTSEYMHRWLGKIVDRYRGSRTRVIFVRLPRGPWVRPDLPPTNPHSSVRDLATQGGATLIAEHQFDFLEEPGMFQDMFHLNGPGSEKFSHLIVRQVREILGPPR